MKKIGTILLLVLFVCVACQTDTVNPQTEAVEKNKNVLEKAMDNTSITELLNNIPEKYKDDPKGYFQSILDDNQKARERYGCVTFGFGGALIDDGRAITSGIPEDFEDCRLVRVEYLACGVNIENPLCIICAVIYTVECEDGLYDVLGYNIVCAFGDPQPL